MPRQHEGGIDKRSRQERIRQSTRIYALLGLLLVLASAAILGATIKTATTDAKAWTQLNANMQRDNKVSIPLRGNIYSDTDYPMAITVYRYTVRLDFRAGGFRDSLFVSNVDTLSHQLSSLFQDRSASSYKQHLMKGYKQQSRSWKVIDREVSHSEFRAMQGMAYLNISNRNVSGMSVSRILRRVMPYGSLAQRTIGHLKQEPDPDGMTHGSSGLEMAFDSVLVGKPGLDRLIFIPPKWVHDPITPPVNGSNVYTTINVDIQDIAEKSLREALTEVEADWGCAVVMEVKTGAIKAMANLDRGSNGKYYERTNHALADLLEPGSTFKAISMLAALERNAVKPTDTIDVGNGVHHYARGLTIRDHNAHKGGYGRITAAQAIWYSSNVGVAKAVLKGFEGRDQDFLDALNGMHIFEQIDMDIPGTTKPNIKQDVSTWTKGTMPWVSFGYEVQMPPIYTLRFYNAVANGGKMVEPYIVRKVSRTGERTAEKEPTVLDKKIASDRSLEALREMLRGVVTDGTGTAMDSPYVTIAGKTGTAQLRGAGGAYGSGGHNVTFCGFFPYEKPLYSCIVVVSRPRGVYPSGAIPGRVLRAIAEQTVAHTREIPISEVVPDSTATFGMEVAAGLTSSIRSAVEHSKVKKTDKPHTGATWQTHQLTSDSLLVLRPMEIHEGIMPDLHRMAVMDAVYAGQKMGLRVVLRGEGGEVHHQSIPAGQSIRRGSIVTLTLR